MSNPADFHFATLQSAIGEAMLTLVPTESQYEEFMSAHWPHVNPSLFVPEADAHATFQVTPQEFSLLVDLDSGKTQQFESKHNAPEWAAECIRTGSILVFVAPPGVDVENINDRLLIDEAQHGRLLGAHVPVSS